MVGFELLGAAQSGSTSLKDAAFDYIRNEIVAGRMQPGTKVDQDRLAESLDISRLPIREALIELATRGYVNVKPRRGAFVVELTVEDVVDHFEVLGMLFALAAERAAAAIDDSTLAELRELDRRIGDARGDIERQVLDRSFFAVINELGSSDRLLLTLRFLALALPNDYYASADRWSLIEAAHRGRMLDALQRRDASAAGAAAAAHLRECGEVVVDQLVGRAYWRSTLDDDAA